VSALALDTAVPGQQALGTISDHGARSTVMVELRTRYLGLDLPSPLVASASRR
jgi:hypothetical protein